MATRQYIGARYVLKVYENSLDPNSAEWENVAFEPLTMVTYQNSSYLSKKQVPANVGNPVTATTYWVCTGYYNGQISALQTDVANINAKIGDLANLPTTDQDSIVDAIIELNSTIGSQITALANNVNPIKGAFVTPEFYGAVGDGVTDDSAAINDALADGRPVVFTANKTYKCDSYITINSNNKLYGNGCKILFDGNTTLTATGDLMIANNTKGILIDNFNFELSNASVLITAISFFNSEQFEINNCTFSQFYGTCIRVDADNDFKIRNCRFYDITGGVGNPGECIFGQSWINAIVENCLAENIDDHFVYITSTSDNIKILNCKVINGGQTSLANLGAAFQLYAKAKNILIDGCSDINCSREAIHMEAYGGGTDTPENVTITNHHSTNCGATWCKIVGNSVDNVDNVIISNCTINSPTVDAIRTEEVSNLVVNGNIIIANTNEEIAMSNTHKAIISNNYLKGNNTTAIYAGIGNAGASDKITIRNNIIDGATNYGVTVKMVSEPVKLSGNIMTNNTPLYSSKASVIGDAHLPSSQHSITFGNTSGNASHYTGDVIFNDNPSSGSPVGWICTSGDGEHVGTLKSFGTIA